MKTRCEWALGTTLQPAMQDYHDKEWGVPVHDDRLLFEFLILEGAQAGLSWATILAKREHYRKVFDNFNAQAIAVYTPEKIASLLNDPGIVRNRLKVSAAVANAQAFLRIQADYGSFDAFIWDFVGGTPIQNRWKSIAEMPAETDLSQKMSKTLKKNGFKFVGPTICYAFMQAVGLVNDHTVDCHRHAEVTQ